MHHLGLCYLVRAHRTGILRDKNNEPGSCFIMSCVPVSQGARRPATGVYKRVHEGDEPTRNAAMTTAAGLKSASKRSCRWLCL